MKKIISFLVSFILGSLMITAYSDGPLTKIYDKIKISCKNAITLGADSSKVAITQAEAEEWDMVKNRNIDLGDQLINSTVPPIHISITNRDCIGTQQYASGTGSKVNRCSIEILIPNKNDSNYYVKMGTCN